MLSVLTQFLSNQSLYVVVDGCRSKLVNVVRGASGKCFGPAVVPLVPLAAQVQRHSEFLLNV